VTLNNPYVVHGGGICYAADVQGLGYQSDRCNGQVAGTTGQSRAIYHLHISLRNMPNSHVCYSAHVQDYGWMREVCDGQEAGRVGVTGLRIEALRIRLTGLGSGQSTVVGGTSLTDRTAICVRNESTSEPASFKAVSFTTVVTGSVGPAQTNCTTLNRFWFGGNLTVTNITGLSAGTLIDAYKP
jgi:uncharacterized protein YjdB